MAEQRSVAGDPATALIEKYWPIVTGKKMKPSREELIQLQKIGKKNDSAAKILAQYYKPINRTVYSYWRKHYEKLSKTSLGRGKMHDVAKRMDYTFAQPEMQQALIDAAFYGLDAAAVILIVTGVGAPLGATLAAAGRGAMRQGAMQFAKKGGLRVLRQGYAKAAQAGGKKLADQQLQKFVEKSARKYAYKAGAKTAGVEPGLTAAGVGTRQAGWQERVYGAMAMAPRQGRIDAT